MRKRVTLILNLTTNLSRINNCQFLHYVHILNGDRIPLRFGKKTYVQNNDLLQIVGVRVGGKKKKRKENNERKIKMKMVVEIYKKIK
ncbi:hypothetical protein POVCU1_013360 [Plasmodium ovale curtisi]|uniref:Uncharacterized protein n=1 Tax=Plasmodium ovale curtisi TaxID=864141 RepID=A0A1A8W3T5_PLAOA|nr:hypothetical protein POVCU1_013360 [Plasmodium ovale curtisi]